MMKIPALIIVSALVFCACTAKPDDVSVLEGLDRDQLASVAATANKTPKAHYAELGIPVVKHTAEMDDLALQLKTTRGLIGTVWAVDEERPVLLAWVLEENEPQALAALQKLDLPVPVEMRRIPVVIGGGLADFLEERERRTRSRDSAGAP